MKLLRSAFVLALLTAVCASGNSDSPPATPSDAKPTDTAAKQFLAKHCLSCHSGAKPKGDVALDKLTADFADRGNRDRWIAALEQIKSGSMPPEKRPRPDAKDATALADWVNSRL